MQKCNIDNKTVIDFDNPDTTPRKLVEMFEMTDEGKAEEREPIKTDIDITAHYYNMDAVDPKLFNLVNVGEKGKLSLDKLSMMRYLKACKIVYSGQTPYMFNGSIYTQIDDACVARVIYKSLENLPEKIFISKNTVSDLIANLRVVSTEIDIEPPKDWESDAYEGTLVPFQNGLYNVDTDTLLPFTPWIFITHQLDAVYDPSIQEHDVERIYRKIIPDKGTLDFFFQMVGYSMFSPKLSPPAIFLIYGPGNTGKSALHKAVETAAGFHNISTLDLAQISGVFTTAQLQGKLINICGETGSGQSREVSKVDGELIKKLSDGQIITVQRKYGHPYEMCNTAKLWFITNSLPDFGDTTSGLYRRLFIIPCRHEQNWEDQIYSNMTEYTAVSWLVNKSMVAYRRFLDNGSKFKLSQEMQIELRKYKSQDALMDFFESWCGTSDKIVVADKLDGMFVSDVYDNYCIFTKNSGGMPLSRRKMSEKIRNEMALDIETVRTTQLDGKPTNKTKFVKII